jgi:hypothetical protein
MRISLGTLAKITLLSGAALCAERNPLLAQTSSVIALSGGRTLEVIGLRRWTVAMIQDSLARYAPSDSLESHACAAVLRYTLHFADAASTTFQFGGGTPDAIIVSVREPQDSARVHYRNMPLDTLGGRKAWKPIADVFREHPNVFWPEVQRRLKSSYGREPQYTTHEDSALAMRFALALDSFHRPADLRDATKALATDPNMFNRAAAALILTNFAGQDAVWWSLVDAVRERDGPVKGLAATILVGLSRSAPRKVNWAPKADGIHAILDGTSLFELDDLMQVLASTGVGPTDARAMIGNAGGEMLLAYMGSKNQVLAGHSRALLTALPGSDLGPNIESWRAWMASL